MSEVLLPGEKGWRLKEKYLREGILLSELVVNELNREGEYYRIGHLA